MRLWSFCYPLLVARSETFDIIAALLSMRLKELASMEAKQPTFSYLHYGGQRATKWGFRELSSKDCGNDVLKGKQKQGTI